MHNKHLGTDQYCYASVLEYLVSSVMDSSPQNNLSEIWLRVQRFNAQHHISDGFSNMTLTMFQKNAGDFPCLKGRAIECKRLGPPLFSVCQELLDPSDDVHGAILNMMRCSCRIDEIVEENAEEFRLPDAAADEMLMQVSDFLTFLNFLNHHFRSRLPRVYLFHETIKFHMLMHCALQSRYLNLKLSYCYAGEDLMRIVKKVVASCCRGTTAHKVLEKFILKYCTGMNCRMIRQEDWFET